MFYSALNIAKYVINRCTNDGCPISNLQLQKILYYLQREYILRSDIKDKLLFDDEIQAWQYGPVVPSVYNVYCNYGAMKIVERYQISLDQYDMRIIDPIIFKKRNSVPWSLVDDTHKKNGPWDRVYRNGIGNGMEIPPELIRMCG